MRRQKPRQKLQQQLLQLLSLLRASGIEYSNYATRSIQGRGVTAIVLGHPEIEQFIVAGVIYIYM